MDYLKELSTQLGGKIRTQELYNWNFKELSFRELVIKNFKDFKLQINEFGNLIEIRIETESDFIMAINNPEKINSSDSEIKVKDFPYKLFIYNDDFNPLVNDDFQQFWGLFSTKIKEIGLSPHESIFITGYYLTYALNSDRDLIPILDYSLDLIKNSPLIFYKSKDERIFKENIPENLRPLIPLLKKWSIPDDSEREQLMEETNEKQKKKLIKTVYPYMMDVNKFLDSFGDEPLSHEATLLGNLAELVNELQIDNN